MKKYKITDDDYLDSINDWWTIHFPITQKHIPVELVIVGERHKYHCLLYDVQYTVHPICPRKGQKVVESYRCNYKIKPSRKS